MIAYTWLGSWEMKCAVNAVAIEEESNSCKRRKVKYEMFNKWVVQYDIECRTNTWLDCESELKAGSKIVTKSKCHVCVKHCDRITGRRNFSDTICYTCTCRCINCILRQVWQHFHRNTSQLIACTLISIYKTICTNMWTQEQPTTIESTIQSSHNTRQWSIEELPERHCVFNIATRYKEPR